jgi:hypothetical protein
MPAIDDTVAATGELGTRSLPTRGVQIGRLAVVSGAKPPSLGPLAQPIDDPSDLLAVEPAHRTHALVAPVDELDDVGA